MCGRNVQVSENRYLYGLLLKDFLLCLQQSLNTWTWN